MQTWKKSIKIAWKKTIKDVKDIWNPFERDVKVNKIFYNYHNFYDNEFYNIIDTFYITDIKSRTVNKVLEIEVTTRRPGLLIGAGGAFIDDLTDYLQIVLGEVKIILKECTLFQFSKYS